MSNVIKGNFRQHNSELPSQFGYRWMDALHKRCQAEESWTYHVGIRVYQTEKRWAFQGITGCGTQPARYPEHSRAKTKTEPVAFSYSTPYYNSDINKLWIKVFKWLEAKNAVLPPELKEIKRKIKPVTRKAKAVVAKIPKE